MDVLADFLAVDFLGTPAWFWIAFLAIVALLLAFDLGVLNKQNRELGVGESLRLSVFYIAVALTFGAWVWWSMGANSAIEYLTGYAIEKALSIDNVFVISLIFSYFAIPARYQYRALLWGILAVLVLRGIMIAVGAALVDRYEWVLYLFGVFLIATGVKMLVIARASRTFPGTLWYAFSRSGCVCRPNCMARGFFVRKADPQTASLPCLRHRSSWRLS